jgi:nucleotide-binding universal stress UspA family protein
VYRSIFFPMINYPAPTLPAAIGTAVVVAQAWGARLTVLNTEVNAPIGLGPAYSMPFLHTMIDEERAKAEANARTVLADFKAQASRANLPHDVERIRTDVFDPDAWAAAARYSDISLLFVDESSAIDAWSAEAVTFGSGRPCIVAPSKAEIQMLRFSNIAIAWDGGRAASRAVMDALPILRHAAEVTVLVAAPDKDPVLASPERLLGYLAQHDVAATSEVIDTTGSSAADVLAEAATRVPADLLIMGAYGRSQVRNFLLGSVTESLLRSPPFPLFLSH